MIVSCIDDRATVGRLRSISHLSSVEFDRALYSLILSGTIRLQKDGVDPWRERLTGERPPSAGLVTEKMKPEGPVKTQPMAPRSKTMSENEVRKMIIEAEKNFREMLDEEILNVFPDSSEMEIQAAYNRLAEIYCPLYYSEDRYLDLKTQLKFIVARLTSAYHRLMERAASIQPFEESAQFSADTVMLDSSAPHARSLLSESGEMKLKELLELVKADPQNVHLLRQAGKKLQLAGRAKEGEKYLLQALKIDTQNIDSHLALADFYQLQGLKFKAFKHLNTILQLQPDNARALEMLGIQKRKKSLYEITAGRS
jgi:tetratricopeptide (TPR) repeat protein